MWQNRTPAGACPGTGWQPGVFCTLSDRGPHWGPATGHRKGHVDTAGRRSSCRPTSEGAPHTSEGTGPGNAGQERACSHPQVITGLRRVAQEPWRHLRGPGVVSLQRPGPAFPGTHRPQEQSGRSLSVNAPTRAWTGLVCPHQSSVLVLGPESVRPTAVLTSTRCPFRRGTWLAVSPRRS